MLVLRLAGRAERRRQEPLRKNHARTQSLAVRPVATLANAIEAIAGSNHPGIRRGPLQILAKVFENRGMVRRHGGEVVEGFVDAGSETCCSHVVAEHAAVDHLREESRLRDQFVQKVRDILLSFRHKGFFVASAAAEGDDHSLFRTRQGQRPERSQTEQRCARCRTRNGAKKIAAIPRDGLSDFTRTGAAVVQATRTNDTSPLKSLLLKLYFYIFKR